MGLGMFSVERVCKRVTPGYTHSSHHEALFFDAPSCDLGSGGALAPLGTSAPGTAQRIFGCQVSAKRCHGTCLSASSSHLPDKMGHPGHPVNSTAQRLLEGDQGISPGLLRVFSMWGWSLWDELGITN